MLTLSSGNVRYWDIINTGRFYFTNTMMHIIMGSHIKLLLLLLLYHTHVEADVLTQTKFFKNALPNPDLHDEGGRVSKREIAENEIGGLNENVETNPTVDNTVGNPTDDPETNVLVDGNTNTSSDNISTETNIHSNSTTTKATVTEGYISSAATPESTNVAVKSNISDAGSDKHTNSSTLIPFSSSSSLSTASSTTKPEAHIQSSSNPLTSASMTSSTTAVETTAIVDQPMVNTSSNVIHPTPSATSPSNTTALLPSVTNTSLFQTSIIKAGSVESTLVSSSSSVFGTINNSKTLVESSEASLPFHTTFVSTAEVTTPQSILLLSSVNISSTTVPSTVDTISPSVPQILLNTSGISAAPAASKVPNVHSSFTTSYHSIASSKLVNSFSTNQTLPIESLNKTDFISHSNSATHSIFGSEYTTSQTVMSVMTNMPTQAINKSVVDDIIIQPTQTGSLNITSTTVIDKTIDTHSASTVKQTSELFVEPSRDVTVKPTGEPKVTQSVEQSVRLSIESTIESTSYPSVHPTSTMSLITASTQTIHSTTDTVTFQITSESTVEPTSKSTSKPTVKPTGDPTPEPTSDSTPEPTPEPTSDSTPEPTSDLTPEPTSVSTSKPTVEPTPEESTSQPSPEPTTAPKTESTSKPASKTTNVPNTEITGEPSNEPTDEPKSEPTSEPGPDPEDEVDPEPTSEPDSTPEPEPEHEFNPDAFAEPGPDWPVAKTEWKQAWHFHIYFFGGLFAALGVYCLTCICRLWNMDHLLSKNYFLILNILVLFVCILRAVYLLVDAYNSSGMFPIILNHLLYSTVFPCLTAMFSILFYALLLATRVRLLSKKIQKLWVLVAIILVHFCLSLTTDILVGFTGDAVIMLFVCQIFFMLWGLIMFIGYLIIFKRLYNGAMTRQVTLQRSVHEHKRSIAHGFHEKPSKLKYTLGLAVKVTLSVAFFGMTCIVVELYGMFEVYGVLGRYKRPEPWPWWVYNLILRTLEFCMCVCVVYVATQPLKYIHKSTSKSVCDRILSCKLICCKNKLNSSDDTSSVGLDHYAATDSDQFGWLRKFKRVSSPDNLYPPHTAEQYKDPDATLLVRKVKNKPSMLVVEDGFVRIRREDEFIQTYPYEVESESSSTRSGDLNRTSPSRDNFSNVSEVNHPEIQAQTSDNVQNLVDVSGLSNYGFAQDDTRTNYVRTVNGRVFVPSDNESVNEETDVDIEVTDSDHSDTENTPHHGAPPGGNNNSDEDIFRPLSMIDLAASMESKLERAFHSSAIADIDNISHTSLPLSLEVHSADSRESVDNELMMERYHSNRRKTDGAFAGGATDTQSSSPSSRLLPSPVRRCNSAESKVIQKSKLVGKKRYFSLCDMEQVGRLDLSSSQGSDYDTRCMNTKDLVTEL